MKASKNIAQTCFSLIIVLAGLYACRQNGASPEENTLSLADSLIQVQRFNERTILISFGAEAISAINTNKGIVVIDAGISTGLTDKFRKKIEDEFQHSHFAYVINTHAHHDHYRGNSVFQEAEIVGHENGPEEIDLYWKDSEKVKKSLGNTVKEYEAKFQECKPHSGEWFDNFCQMIRYQSAYLDVQKGIPIRKPGIIFTDSLIIDMGDITFEMKYFGRCHSNSDILIYVPELKMLYSGDLIFPYGRPGIRDKAMAEKDIWPEAVAWTEKKMHNIERIITGHGLVLTIEDLIDFNRIILEK